MVSENGSVCPVAGSARPRSDVVWNKRDGGVHANGTDRRWKEEQLVQSQKMEAGGVAHDFNNLLTILLGYSELLLNTLEPNDPGRELVGEIQRAGERATSLTQQLLAFSRKQTLCPKVLDLNTVVSDLEKMLGRAMGEDIELLVKLCSNPNPIKIDSSQVQQILINLAVNARDAMPQGGTLIIETRNIELKESDVRSHPEARPGPYVQLAVSDTGCGMTPEVKAHLFEPFFTTKDWGKGTGLGLATVCRIVRQSGGHVEVVSEPGAGTICKVFLPRAKQLLSCEQPLSPPEGVQGGTETILLVEDDEGIRTLTRRVLQRCGYVVLEATQGQEALGLCKEHTGPIHLLLTDVVMPQMGGRQVADALRCLRPETRVLFISGHTPEAVSSRGVTPQQDNFLQKPFALAALAGKVRELLDQR
jgi:two-component system cell cycle sensor histidine kinase/response regulator CckA